MQMDKNIMVIERMEREMGRERSSGHVAQHVKVYG